MLYPEILPIAQAGAVTPHDTNHNLFRALYVGVAGDVTYVDLAGNTVLLKNLVAGVWHPFEGQIVKSTGTGATDIVRAIP